MHAKFVLARTFNNRNNLCSFTVKCCTRGKGCIEFLKMESAMCWWKRMWGRKGRDVMRRQTWAKLLHLLSIHGCHLRLFCSQASQWCWYFLSASPTLPCEKELLIDCFPLWYLDAYSWRWANCIEWRWWWFRDRVMPPLFTCCRPFLMELQPCPSECEKPSQRCHCVLACCI